jgi:ABC-type nitrate/sulfonate/bicarbonate transport system substrate-binding protein
MSSGAWFCELDGDDSLLIIKSFDEHSRLGTFRERNQENMEKVKVAITSFTPNMLDLLLAKERGFYSAQGLDVEWVPLAGERGVKALAQGKADFAIQIAAALKLAITEGVELKVILIIHKDPPHWIMARPGLSGIQALRGKSVGSGARGSDSSILVEGWLEQSGLKPGVDVQVTYHGSQPEWARGWIRMTDDAPLAIPLEREMLEAKGWRPLVELTRIFPGLLTHGLVVSEGTLKEQPETIRKMIRAHRAVVKYMKESSEDVIAYIQDRWEVDREVAAKSYSYLWPAFVADLNADYLAPVLDVTARSLGRGLLKPEDFMDARLFREVNEQ